MHIVVGNDYSIQYALKSAASATMDAFAIIEDCRSSQHPLNGRDRQGCR